MVAALAAAATRVRNAFVVILALVSTNGGVGGTATNPNPETQRVYLWDQNRCVPKPAMRTDPVYGNVSSIRPYSIETCLHIPVVEQLLVNAQVGQIIFRNFTQGEDNGQILLLQEVRGSIWFLDVISEGSQTAWDTGLVPKRPFSDESCLDRDLFCGLASAYPIREGYMAIDRHRIQRYNYTWMPDERIQFSDVHETLVATFGDFNADNDGNGQGEDLTRSLRFPTELVEYSPDSIDFVSLDQDIPVWPLYPGLYNLSLKGVQPRFLIVTDTGNHRVVLLDHTDWSEMTYIGQFGISGVAGSGDSALNWPTGIAICAPPVYSFDRPALANIYIADQLNDRLVKLDLIDTDSSGFALAFGGQYGDDKEMKSNLRGLDKPVGVAVYRHYIFVGEADSNQITILMVDYKDTTKLIFVTLLQPLHNVLITGRITATFNGYVWYTYTLLPATYSFGSFYLKDSIRKSSPPSLYEDLLATCISESYFDTVLYDEDLFQRLTTYMLDLAGINWRFPGWKRGTKGRFEQYIDWKSFNLTRPGGAVSYDFQTLNASVFQGKMVFCDETPARSEIDFQAEGGGGPLSSKDVGTSAAAPLRHSSSPFLLLLLLLLFDASLAFDCAY